MQKVAAIFDLCGLLPLCLVNFCKYSPDQHENVSIMSRMFWRSRIVALEHTFIIKWTDKTRKTAVIFDLAGVSIFAFFSLNFDSIGPKMVPFDSSYQNTQKIILKFSN
jgi:hypothetical protein